MLRFIVRRIFFIALVWVFIVFFSNLGMRMARNSEIARPDYNLVQHSKRAWQESRYFRLAGGGAGRFGIHEDRQRPGAGQGHSWGRPT